MTFHSLSNVSEVDKFDGKVIALGCFDGFHLGHREVIISAVELAKSIGAEPAVFCFDIPPACYSTFSTVKILDGGDRLQLFADAGIKSVYIADFLQIKDMDAGQFIDSLLIGECSARGVVCGFNFKFGRGRSGTPELLKQYFGNNAITLDPVYYGDSPISSSRIRAALADGDVELSAKLLGRHYSLNAPVISGRQDGRKLGFPTLNQIPDHSRAIPASGVYVTLTTMPNREVFPSITDVGLAPTLDKSGIIRFETHILDKYIDYTPNEIKVEFLTRIREERHFGSFDELKAQIRSDSDFARQYFSKINNNESNS